MTPPEPPAPRLTPEQIAELLVRLLFVSSSGFALFQLAHGNEYTKALIALAISAMSGLSSSFGAGLMEILNERWKKRGQKLAEVIDKPFTQISDNFSSFKQQYLTALIHYCHELEVEGLKGDFPSLPLEEVFVPIKFDFDTSYSGSISIKQIWSLLPQKDQLASDSKYRLLAIIANPGYGKTTLTRYLTLQYAKANNLNIKANSKKLDITQEYNISKLLPFLLVFRSIYPLIQDEQTPTLPELLQKQVKNLPRCRNIEVSADWFEQRLKNGECLVLLDGLDEVPETHRRIVSQWSCWQMQAYPSQFILTSRPHGYDSSLFRGVKRIGIIDFTIDQKEDFISKWYKAVLWRKKWEIHFQLSKVKGEDWLSEEQAQSQSDAEAEKAAKDLFRQIIEIPNLNELAKNPLLITIIAATHRAFASLPKRRVEIYKKIFELLLADRPNYRETPLPVRTVEENLHILQQLALALTKKGKTQFTDRNASSLLESLLAKYSDELQLTPEKFLRETQQISGLLSGGESNLYQFSHKTFQEYLTALALKENPRAREFLIGKIKAGNWKDWEEVIRFYAMLTGAEPFIEASLITTNKDALLLAYQICIEDTERVPSTLKIQLYQKLKEVDLGKELNAKVKLEEQFQSRRLLDDKDDKTIISSDYITWMEYCLFLEAQQTGQFHSKAKVEDFATYSPENRIFNVSQTDAYWFCAWLSTQFYLHPEDATYNYRLPTIAELAKVRSHNGSTQNIQPWTDSSAVSGNALRIVRERIDRRYKGLLNFLVNGRWKEADQETERLILELADHQDKGYLSIDDWARFPIHDLQLIDHLWLKFSGGRFGLTLQRQLWLKLGGKLDFGEDNDNALQTHKKMSDRNGWRNKKEWLNYSTLNFSLAAPVAHLPTLYRVCRLSPGVTFGGSAMGWCAVLSCLQQLNREEPIRPMEFP